MPELPEVETTRRGIRPHILGHTVSRTTVRNRKLRWPIPAGLEKKLQGSKLLEVSRRAKYLLLTFENGTLIIHLGMSGSLRILKDDTPPEKHDHFDLCFDNHQCLRLRDPRRFGAVLWTTDDPLQHKLIIDLGPEPHTGELSGQYLMGKASKRKVPIKNFIMDGKVVVGVGNIYASESLFMAGINPKRSCHKISASRYEKLAQSIETVICNAIKKGGTTLRDFTSADGSPGYFQQELNVYGRTGERCHQCATPVKQITLGQRSTFYCPKCQK